MNSGNMQLSALQHQQLRTQQGLVSGGNMSGQHGMGQSMAQSQVIAGHTNNPMAQMNNMNQQMLSHMQQQQNIMQQNSQVSF